MGQTQPLTAQHSSALILHERGTHCMLTWDALRLPSAVIDSNREGTPRNVSGKLRFGRRFSLRTRVQYFFLFFNSNQVRVGTTAGTIVIVHRCTAIAWCYLLPADSSQCP